jgi:type II secretory pathway component PulJ
MIAVALSALLLTAVYWTYFSIYRSIDAATESQEAFETGRILSEMIKRDIRGMRTGRFPLIAKNEVTEGIDTGQMEFVTSVRTAPEQTSLRRIGYALVLNRDDENIMVRKESSNLTDLLDDTARVFEISRIVTGFQIEFYNGTEWVKAWDSGSQGTVPKQIRVVIDVTDAKGKNKTFTAEESVQSAG